MAVDWQQTISLGIVAVTVVLFALAKWRSDRGAWHCVPHCQRLTQNERPRGRIICHARRGEPPTITIKFE
jgi:hypothetical protein